MSQCIDIDAIAEDARKTFSKLIRKLNEVSNEESWDNWYKDFRAKIKGIFGTNSDEYIETENLDKSINSSFDLEELKNRAMSLAKRVKDTVKKEYFWENKRLMNHTNTYSNNIITNSNIVVNSNSPNSNIKIKENTPDFEKIAKIINESNIQNKKEIMFALNELKQSTGNKDNFIAKYNEFIASLANHTTVLIPILNCFKNIFP